MQPSWELLFYCALRQEPRSPTAKRLYNMLDAPTVLTRAFSGRLARGLENPFITHACAIQKRPCCPFPAQNALTRTMRVRSASQGHSDYLSLWAGTGHGALQTAGQPLGAQGSSYVRCWRRRSDA